MCSELTTPIRSQPYPDFFTVQRYTRLATSITPRVISVFWCPSLGPAPSNGWMPCGGTIGAPVPVGTAAPVLKFPPLVSGIGNGAPVAEVLMEVDTITSGTEVSDGTSGTVAMDSSGEDSELMASALELDAAEGEPSAGGVASPDGRMEVTVLPAMVLVNVCVEVEVKVVVGSPPGAPPSRVARDARGKERRTEVSRRRMS